MTPETIALDALSTIEATHAPADRVLRRTLRRHPELDNAQRKRVADLVLGVRCHRLRLAYLAERYPTLSLVERYGRRDELEVEWPEDPVERLVVERSIPRFVAEAFHRQYGARADVVAATLNRRGPIAIRARGDPGLLAARLEAEGMQVAPARLAPRALRLTGRPDIRGSAAWRSGAFEVQDEASQMVAVAVDAQPGETVIDLCAGAGGKTLALAAAMGDRGTIYACDVDPDRLHDLEVRLARGGQRCVVPMDLRTYQPPAGADRVLVDAPCSGVGTWRRGPDRKWRIDADAIEELVALQRQLLARAAALVRPGGRVVYATCTLLRAENQGVVETTTLAPSPLGCFEGEAYEITPDAFDTDGFFVAAFTRPA